jgi:hypothetical protein
VTRVDDVDAVLGQGLVHAFPEGGGGRRDRDATFLLFSIQSMVAAPS